MAGQQGWLLHNGVIMASMRVGIPGIKHNFCEKAVLGKKQTKHYTGIKQ